MPKLMIVDDSASQRLQLSSDLTSAGYSVVEAENGKVALDKIQTLDQVDLLICDLNMPKMNGLELVAELRKIDRFKSLQVFILTSDGSPDQKQIAKKLGAVAWIVKPYQKSSLLEGIATMLKKSSK